MRLLVVIIFIGIVFGSCSKAIEFDLPEVEQDVVIVGKIESGNYPIVFLSKTQGYFEPTSAESIFGTSIHNAYVTMNDGVNEIILNELCSNNITDPNVLAQVSQVTGIPVQNLQYFNYCIYSNLDSLAIGVEGRTYSLYIETETDTLTASTILPMGVPLVNPHFEAFESLDSLGFLFGTLVDPPEEGNSYRWFAQRINTYKYNYPAPYDNVIGMQKDAFPIAPFGSVFDDKFLNGLSLEIEYNRGEVGNLEGPDDEGPEEGYFKRGDTVVIKFTTIDHLTYLHLRALEDQAATNGSPFASPGNLPSSVVGGIGLWAGYGVRLDTVICN